MSSEARRPRPTEWDATEYHRVSAPQLAWGGKVLARLSLRGDETVLDAGCGTGRLTAQLLERLPHGRVIALDQSKSMLRMARQQLEPRFGDRVSFVHADLQRLRLDSLVEVIFSTATFHWVLDHVALFEGLFATLEPGGRLHAQCGGGPNLARFHRLASDLMGVKPFAPFFSEWSMPWEFADAETTAARMRAAGFCEVETGLEAAPTPFASARDCHDFLFSVVLGAHLARLPDDAMRHRFIAEIVAQLARADPSLTLDYWRLNLEARRPE